MQSLGYLDPYIPIPDEIRNHHIFIRKIKKELAIKYPDDEFLKSLDKEENLEIFYLYAWYERYGINK
ncbi:hypothetical protein [Malaciobacter marinus]|jgi:hypothetical protein|uniref:hypothetical protein n=1 Tax=Malaciobacter marinus TaxID=505249 RepID=UPI0009A57FEA|nr:hypothetical protein [Malaciobacter marinus]SKB79472.1 hypothetical protein SAMN06295997_14512 [Malaciobacter marinus]